MSELGSCKLEWKVEFKTGKKGSEVVAVPENEDSVAKTTRLALTWRTRRDANTRRFGRSKRRNM